MRRGPDRSTVPRHIGHGIGLRAPHHGAVLDGTLDASGAGWLEVITENFLVEGGNPRRVLRAARARGPVVLHGVSLDLGGVDPLDERYLASVRALAHEIEPAWISDHLCFGGFGGHRAHDLWPLPHTEESLRHVAARVRHVQERLGRRLLVENVSSYVRFAASTIDEPVFLAALAEQADCGLLVDVNNVVVSAHNHGFDPVAYVDALPGHRIGQIHLAGHADHGTHRLDTHDRAVDEETWALYRHLIRRHGPVATLVEWDDDIPPLDRLVAESNRAAAVEAEVLAEVLAEDATSAAESAA